MEIEQKQEIKILWGRKITDHKMAKVHLTTLVQRMRSSDGLKDACTEVRDIAAQCAAATGDQWSQLNTQRQQRKADLLPYFTFGEFKDNYLDKKSFQRTKFILFDIDHLSNDKLENVRNKMRMDNRIMLNFVSPSGDGLKVTIELDDYVTTEDDYHEKFAALKDLIETEYEVEVGAENDPSRACYVSYDPSINLRDDNIPVHVEPLKKLKGRKARKGKEKQTLDDLAAVGAKTGNRTHALTQLVGLFISKGLSEEIALQYALSWNSAKNEPPLDDSKVAYTVRDLFKRYSENIGQAHLQLGGQWEVSTFNNRYSIRNMRSEKKIPQDVSNFIIEPLSLLTHSGGDFLRCNIVVDSGQVYYNITIENADWASRSRFIKCLGHSDLTFNGTDKDLQIVAAYVTHQVPERKKGSKVVGLIEGTWVVDGLNITAEGVSENPNIVVHDRGSDAFYRRISYVSIDDISYRNLVGDFCYYITRINDFKTVMPLLGWVLASPLAQLFVDHGGSFPVMLVHGSAGSGKTSTAQLMMRLCGYTDTDELYNADMKPFPMLRLLSSSQGIPQFFDEFKADMKEGNRNNLFRYIRQIYNHASEVKGNADQTVTTYHLTSPLCLMGEGSITQPAVRERIVFADFTDVIKTNIPMQEAYERLNKLPLEAFMPRYVKFLLEFQKIAMTTYDDLLGIVRSYFKHGEKSVSPRVMKNIAVMLTGLKMFIDHARIWGAEVNWIDVNGMIDSQLSAITNSENGEVMSAVDQLLSGLSQFSQYKMYLAGYRPWAKIVSVDDKDAVAIDLTNVLPEFREWAKKTSWSGDLLDDHSYKKMLRETSYVLDPHKVVKFSKGKTFRCAVIDITLVKKKGVDIGAMLEVFGGTQESVDAYVTPEGELSKLPF